MAEDYLSTDPNAGLDDGEYLSTDPNAGQHADSGAGLAASGLALGSAALPAVVAGAKRAVEAIAENPKIPGLGSKIANLGGHPLRRISGYKQAFDVLSGNQSPIDAAKDFARNEIGQQVITRTPSLVQRLAQAIAPHVAGASGITAAGALAGAAVPAAVLAAMETDANRNTTGIEHEDSIAGQIARLLLARQADIDLPNDSK